METQEKIIGRHKQSNIELDEAVKPSSSHGSPTTITDEQGNEVKILRQHIAWPPRPARIAPTLSAMRASQPPIEQMLENMFIGRPAGNYDRLLDFSHAVTGTLFFVPSAPRRWKRWPTQRGAELH
ncbi:Dyp-type peroxidase [Serratia ureilytica]